MSRAQYRFKTDAQNEDNAPLREKVTTNRIQGSLWLCVAQTDFVALTRPLCSPSHVSQFHAMSALLSHPVGAQLAPIAQMAITRTEQGKSYA